MEDFEIVKEAFSKSAVGRLATAVRTAFLSAVQQARALGPFRGLVHALEALDRSQRVRLSGFAVMTFVFVHVALLQMVPPSTAPFMPMLFWVAVSLIGVVLITAAPALARAWETRAIRWRPKPGRPQSAP
jgi:hypothetical protein